MTVVESRLKKGVLTLGPTDTPDLDFSCQVTNARIKSSYNDDDGEETLCGDMVAGDTTLKGRSLAGTAIQDFDSADGWVNYCFAHDLEIVPFVYTPNATGSPTYTGNVRVRVPDETAGGDVNTRLKADFEWQISGTLGIAYPEAPPLAAGEPVDQGEGEDAPATVEVETGATATQAPA
jgi:hypothetical protein